MFMTRLLVLISLPLVLTFALVALLIQSRPYDPNPVLNQVLAPPGCAAPCWLGIQPGLTATEKALDIFRSQHWLGEMDNRYYVGQRGWMIWRWSERAPDWLQRGADISRGNSLTVDQNRVISLNVSTGIRFGDVWLALGQPDWITRYVANQMIHLNSAYLDEAFVVILHQVPCADGSNGLWFAPVQLVWSIQLPPGGQLVEVAPGRLAHCGT